MIFKKTGMHELRVHAHNGLHITTIYGIAGTNITIDSGHFNENGISTFEIYEPDGNLFSWSELNEYGIPSSDDCNTVFKVRLTPSYYKEVISIDELIEPCEIVCCPEEEEELEVNIIHNYVPNVRPPIDDWIATLIIPEYCEGQGDIRWTLPDGTTRECVPRIIMPENGTYMVEYICPETGCGISYSFEFDQI